MSASSVLVVGAGPAGSSLALRLARRGVDVTLVDGATFPRSKPCGDCISPGASPLLEELGVLRRVGERAGRLGGWRIRSPGGATAEGRFGTYAGTGPPRGLALPREELDGLLLEAALEAGADLREATKVFALLRRGDRVVGVRARDRSGRELELGARLVVGADGLRSVVARRLAGVRRGPRRRLALVGRYRSVAPVASREGGKSDRDRAGGGDAGGAPPGEMRIGHDGCLGLAPLGRGRWNATLVVPLAEAKSVAADRRAYFRRGLRRYGVASRFRDAEPIGQLEITGPFQLTPRRRSAPGALLVGDAAGYFDPMTGQGVHRALATAAAAAGTVQELLTVPGPAAESAARTRYESALERLLAPGRRLQAALDALAARPALTDRAVALLAARPGLADLLVDVTGDRLSAGSIADPRRLLPALVAPGPGRLPEPHRPRRPSTPAPGDVPCAPTTRS